MAKFTFDIPDGIEKQIEALEHAEKKETIVKMLESGGESVEKEMKQQCKNFNQSGNMLKSIKTTKATKNEKGYFVVTRPTGKEVRIMKNGKKHTIRNMEKLAYLHYGTTKQPATGIVTKVINSAKEPALNAMQSVYNMEEKV